jgi:hypothetical protein
LSLRPKPAGGLLAARLAVGLSVISAGRPLWLIGATGIGLAAGWAASGRLALLAGLAVGLAAANGCAKAYSP